MVARVGGDRRAEKQAACHEKVMAHASLARQVRGLFGSGLLQSSGD